MGLEILENNLDVVHDSLAIGEADLHLFEMVIADNALHEATNKEERSIEGHVGINLVGRRHGADSEGESIGNVNTSVEVVTIGPVGLLLGNILLDLSAVEKPVFGNCLGESGGLGEDLAPGFDLGDIIAHALAGGHGSVEFGPDGSGVL